MRLLRIRLLEGWCQIGLREEWLTCCAPGGFFLTLVGGDALGEGVAMDAEHGGGVGDVLLVTGECLLDVELLEFAERFVKKDVAFEHFVDQGFKAVMNQSSFPVNNL